eukprot:SAG31_NODE_3289_length_4458_cov_2.567791_5_plen_72_part_00
MTARLDVNIWRRNNLRGPCRSVDESSVVYKGASHAHRPEAISVQNVAGASPIQGESAKEAAVRLLQIVVHV